MKYQSRTENECRKSLIKLQQRIKKLLPKQMFLHKRLNEISCHIVRLQEQWKYLKSKILQKTFKNI